MDADYVATREYLHQEHYYGRVVRKFSLWGGTLMLLSLPFFSDLIHVNIFVSLTAVLMVGFAAGLLTPASRSLVLVNAVVSMLATFIFEYQAVSLYGDATSFRQTVFFVVNQLLALNFFFATYYSAKSVRGLFVKTKVIHD